MALSRASSIGYNCIWVLLHLTHVMVQTFSSWRKRVNFPLIISRNKKWKHRKHLYLATQFTTACVCTCNTLSPFYLRCANRWEFNELNHRCTLHTYVSAIAPDRYGFSLLGDGAFKGRPHTRLQVRKVWNHQPHKVLKFQACSRGDCVCDYSVTFVQSVRKYSRAFYRQSSATLFCSHKMVSCFFNTNDR